ncbi:voltage-gated potassium channel subunit beta-1 isoform X2 [Silurus meridionalis]|nr:voltage-gated potassium channel subunit beta-1 isoform X2 [Silurus meridionalis]
MEVYQRLVNDAMERVVMRQRNITLLNNGWASGAMFAARTGTVGRGLPDEALRHRKQSAASLSGPRGQRSSQDSSRDSRRQSQHTVLAQARRVELIREIETKWYLKLCGRAKEDCVAFQTGMPYRIRLLERLGTAVPLLGSEVEFMGRAVVSQQGEQQWAKYTALRGPSAQCDGVGDAIHDPNSMKSSSQKVQDPVKEGNVQAQQVQFFNHLLRNDNVEC